MYNGSLMNKRKDGRYQKTAMVQGKKVFGYGTTPEEAQANLESKLPAPTHSAPQTLHDAAELLWYPAIQGKQESTKRRYIAAYIQHIRDVLGPLPLTEIKTATIQAWVNALGKKQVSRSGKGKNVAPMKANGIHFVYTVLSRILEYAYLSELITRNPCNKLVTLPPRPEKRERVLTVEEAAELLENAPRHLKLPIFLSMLCGMRRGEVCGLQWSDLDRQKKTLSIRRQVDNKNKVKNLKTTSSKRTLILPTQFVDFIDKYGDLDSLSIVPISPRDLTDGWAEWKGKPKDWTFHDLRHGAAGLIEATTGGNVLSSQAVLGHSKPDMTTTYIGMKASRIESALEGLTTVLTTKKQ